MLNDDLLFKKNETNSKIKFNIKKKMIECKIDSGIFNGITVKNIIMFVNAVQKKFLYQRISINFNLGSYRFEDKLTYIIFECICNYLITKCNRGVFINAIIKKDIWTEGIYSSPLLLLNTNKKESVKKFKNNFKKDLYKNHYRRIIEISEKKDQYLMCKIMSDIDSFLKFYSIEKEYRDMISEVITELIDNACEHANSDCLVDIDITSEYIKENEEGYFYGINIAILNFSDKLLGSSIAEKIKHKEVLNHRHLNLIDAYNNHKDKFSKDKYLEEDFYNIASFQHKISGRLENESTGGTGLTKLISRLEKCSDTYKCYAISGNRVVWFNHDYLSYNEDNWIGFNNENDFLNCIPDEKNVNKCHIYMPGTAYNLNFVMKKEEI